MSFKKLLKKFIDPRSGWQTASLVVAAALIYLWRASQYLFKPQLFAEDGILWLAEGRAKSILALLEPVNGFFHISERLFGFVVARLPLHLAPLIFVVTAWSIFILMVYYLLSARTKILTTNYERLFGLVVIGMMANVYEIFFNFSNSIFLLGIIGALILIAKPAKYLAIRIIEKAIFVLACLTLPFAWFYLPIAAFEHFKYKKANKFFLITAFLTAIAQLACVLGSQVVRSPVTLQALLSKFTVLEVYNQIIVPALRFTRMDIPVFGDSNLQYPVYWIFLSLAAVLLAAYIVLKSSQRQVWYLLFFLAAMTLASLKSPTISIKDPVEAIKYMSGVTGASRYFIYGILAVNLIFVKTAYRALVPSARWWFMAVFIGFSFMTALQAKTFYIEKNFSDYRPQYHHAVDLIEAGQVDSVSFPVNPAPWTMILDRR